MMNWRHSSKYIKWFEEVGLKDVDLVGGKVASLDEMVQAFSGKDIRVPGGFAVTADAYSDLLRSAGIEGSLRELLLELDKNNVVDLSR